MIGVLGGLLLGTLLAAVAREYVFAMVVVVVLVFIEVCLRHVFFVSFEIFLIGEMQLGASLYVSFWFEVVFLDALLPSHTVSNVFAARQKWKLNFV